MGAQKRIHGTRLKIERAKEHIRNFDVARQSFIQSKPYTIGTKPHPVPQIEHTTLYIADVKPIPDIIPLIIGDAVHNLRSALDFLMWQLVEAGGGVPDKTTYFPVADGPQQYASAMGKGEIHKIASDARDIIHSVQPFICWDQTLWLLHHLDIMDKHRLLLVAMATMDKWGVDLASRGPGGITLWFDQHSRYVPLVVGYEFTNLPTSTYQRQAHQDFQLGLDIAFGKPEVAEGELVLYTLNKMSDFVDGLVAQFERFLC